MAGKVTLTVNGNAIEMEVFIASLLENTVAGMAASLKGIDEIKDLSLIFAGEKMDLRVNGAPVSATEFVVKIFRSTIFGMVAPLKGVANNIESLVIKIER